MIFIGIMSEITTIPVSRKFHEWLKGKGKKGESYEAIIKRMLNSEAQQELEASQPSIE